MHRLDAEGSSQIHRGDVELNRPCEPIYVIFIIERNVERLSPTTKSANDSRFASYSPLFALGLDLALELSSLFNSISPSAFFSFIMPRRTRASNTDAPLATSPPPPQQDAEAQNLSLLRRQWKWAAFSQFFCTFSPLFAMNDVTVSVRLMPILLSAPI